MSEKQERTPLTVTVYEKPTLVANNTYRLRLVKPEGFTFIPGQAMKFNFGLEFKEDGKPWNKSFTIASAPHEGYLEFIFRVQQDKTKWSKTKTFIMNLKEGDEVPMLDVLRDYSDEVIYPEQEPGVSVVMLAAGVGVSPFISMMRHAQHIGDKRDFHLLYSNPTYEDVVYEDEIEAYEHSLAPNLHAKKFLTQKPAPGFRDGYFSKDAIRSITNQTSTIPIFFISGTPKMVDETKTLLEELHIPDSRIRVKKFKGYEQMDDTIRG